MTADGVKSVLLNIYSQPDASTLDIANELERQLHDIRAELPPDVKTAYFYDQSILVRNSVRSVWEAIVFGLILSVAILYLFLKNWGSTLVATLVIPITVLFTVLVMYVCGLSFNLMTLGGIAAAIGLIIDDAIVVVEAIYSRIALGAARAQAVQEGISEIFAPLLGSTLTPVVVFVPLAFLTGITGVFFRALAITMVVALLTSLALALTLTPSLASFFVRGGSDKARDTEGFLMRWVVELYERIVRLTMRHRWFTLACCILILVMAYLMYGRLKSDFLPVMDEGGFVIDYIAPPGTSLTETDRQMQIAEGILKTVPEVESYSRRTGAALGVHLVEPNTGDFLVKLKPGRRRGTDEVIAELRHRFTAALSDIDWDFPGILSDSDWGSDLDRHAVEVILYSNDTGYLTSKADDIEEALKTVPASSIPTTAWFIRARRSV